MKSYISKFLLGAAAMVAAGGVLTSCVGDLDRMPKDPNSTTPGNFTENPKEYLQEVMGKCYSSLAVSGQGGPGGDADISGLDGGASKLEPRDLHAQRIYHRRGEADMARRGCV